MYAGLGKSFLVLYPKSIKIHTHWYTHTHVTRKIIRFTNWMYGFVSLKLQMLHFRCIIKCNYDWKSYHYLRFRLQYFCVLVMTLFQSISSTCTCGPIILLGMCLCCCCCCCYNNNYNNNNIVKFNNSIKTWKITQNRTKQNTHKHKTYKTHKTHKITHDTLNIQNQTNIILYKETPKTIQI